MSSLTKISVHGMFLRSQLWNRCFLETMLLISHCKCTERIGDAVHYCYNFVPTRFLISIEVLGMSQASQKQTLCLVEEIHHLQPPLFLTRIYVHGAAKPHSSPKVGLRTCLLTLAVLEQVLLLLETPFLAGVESALVTTMENG